MSKLRKKSGGEPLNYWQSTADMMSALLLILLLVVMLLLLYIIQIPEEELVDSYPGSYSTSAGSYEDDDWDGGGAWGGGGGGGDGDHEEEYEYPEPGGGGGGYGIGDGNGKTAVYVMVIDAETEATIKESGIRFELYTQDGGLQLLNTYYPRRVEYREYQTTVEGVFFLPEKVQLGEYFLHELNEPEGYDSAGNVYFVADEDRDWNEPLVVVVPLSPSKNIIRIRMIDSDTGQPVAGGIYNVTAAEDIVTQDGTLRYSAGQTVDQILCDSSGYGESIELYLGDYILTQSTVPQYYAADAEPLEVSVEKKKNGVEPPVHQISCEKTTVLLQVSDELYPTMGLEGASFWLAREGGSGVSVVTDAGGQLVLTNLEKSTTYRLRQLSSQDNYTFSEADLVFTVSPDGRIEEEIKKEYTITNRITRVELSVVDRVLRSQVSDQNVALYTPQDELLGVWDSTGLAKTLEGLEPGTYYIVLGGRTDRRRAIQVQDTAEIQAINIPIWTLPGVGILLLILALLTGGMVLLILHRRRRAEQLPVRAPALAAAASSAGPPYGAEPPAGPDPAPVTEPAEEPKPEATGEPAEEPNPEPTAEPAEESDPEATTEPAEDPKPEPTAEPAEEPNPEPTAEPAEESDPEPTGEPAEEPNPEPAAEPAEEPNLEPTAEPGQKYTFRAEKPKGRKPAAHSKPRRSFWGRKQGGQDR